MAMTRRPAAVEWRAEREEEPRRSRGQRRPEEAGEDVTEGIGTDGGTR